MRDAASFPVEPGASVSALLVELQLRGGGRDDARARAEQQEPTAHCDLNADEELCDRPLAINSLSDTSLDFEALIWLPLPPEPYADWAEEEDM